MEAPGIEPGAVFPQECQEQKVTARPVLRLAHPLACELQNDPDLAHVVAAWPGLQAPIRAGILAMVQAAEVG